MTRNLAKEKIEIRIREPPTLPRRQPDLALVDHHHGPAGLVG